MNTGGMQPPGPEGWVGREAELAALTAALDDVLVTRGRTLIVFGEGGIGKTRLADELTARATFRGATALWGRCWEGGGAPAFWPWVQIFRALGVGAQRGESSLSALAGIAHTSGSPSVPTDPDYARFQLFDAASRFLQNTSASKPLVLVIDDLHAADVPSLLLLQFLARSLREARILVLGTSRERELRARADAAEAVDAVCREADRIVLTGLGPSEVRTLIQATAGGAVPSGGLVARIHRDTDGNPFFVGSLVRLLMAEQPTALTDPSPPADLRLPAHLRDTIRRRLAPLSEDCVRILSLASVTGREFDLRVVERLSGIDPERVTRLIEEAATADVVRAAPEEVGSYGFSHPLVREALYEGLDLPTRMRLHQRVGELLEDRYRVQPEPHLAELAHHFVMASAIGDPDKVLEYATRAGLRAAEQLAHEEATIHFRNAVVALERKPLLDEPRRFELLLELGEAAKAVGKATESAKWFQQAVESARRVGSSESLARAALGLAGIWVVRTGTRDEALLRLLEESLHALGDHEDVLRARVLARLAMELRWAGSAERRAALSGEAVALARRLEDPRTLAFVLMAKHWAIPGPDDVAERLETAAEIVSLAERAADRPMELVGRTWRMTALLELGQMPLVHEEIRTIGKLADDIRLPYYRWWSTGSRAVVALLEGRFDDAEQIANEELELGQEAQSPDALQCYGLQITMVRREQNRLDEVEGMLRAFVQDIPLVPAWRAMLGALYAELGREAEARRELEAFLRDGFRSLTRDDYWLAAMTALAELAATLGHREAAEVLYQRLLPYGDRNSVVGLTILCNGPVSRDLGMLAITLARYDEAVKWLEIAVERSQAIGWRTYAVRSRLALAEALRGRRRSGDAARAAELVAIATAEAEEIGMKSVLVASARDDAVAEAPEPGFVLRRHGDLWAIGRDGGSPKFLKEMKGLWFLAHLIAHAGENVGALALSAAAGRVSEESPRRPAAPRNRKAPASEERARVAATKAIRLAIRAIAREDAVLGRHLDESVKTGKLFSYQPTATKA